MCIRDRYLSADIAAGWANLDREPHIGLELSKDRGHTYYRKSLRSMGARGDFNALLRWWGIGQARELYAKLIVKEPVALSVYGAHVAFNVGVS